MLTDGSCDGSDVVLNIQRYKREEKKQDQHMRMQWGGGRVCGGVVVVYSVCVEGSGGHSKPTRPRPILNIGLAGLQNSF